MRPPGLDDIAHPETIVPTGQGVYRYAPTITQEPSTNHPPNALGGSDIHSEDLCPLNRRKPFHDQANVLDALDEVVDVDVFVGRVST
jgi:hypothetical protein